MGRWAPLLLVVAILLVLLLCAERPWAGPSVSRRSELSSFAPSWPVDAVVTWVDAGDPRWRAARGVASPDDDLRFNTKEAPDSELSLCLDLLDTNCPWLRKIFVITARPQIPSCLAAHPRAVLVHHDKIFGADSDSLPVFNSRAIEAHLHRIPGLSERFLYLNDDFYVLRPVLPGDFFSEDGHPLCRYERYWAAPVRYAPPGMADNHLKGWQYFADNVAKTPYVFKLWHHPQPLTKELLRQAELSYAPEWRSVARQKERSPRSIAPVGSAVHLGLLTGRARGISGPDRLRALFHDRDSVPDLSGRPHLLACNAFKEPRVSVPELRRRIQG